MTFPGFSGSFRMVQKKAIISPHSVATWRALCSPPGAPDRTVLLKARAVQGSRVRIRWNTRQGGALRGGRRGGGRAGLGSSLSAPWSTQFGRTGVGEQQLLKKILKTMTFWAAWLPTKAPPPSRLQAQAAPLLPHLCIMHTCRTPWLMGLPPFLLTSCGEMGGFFSHWSPAHSLLPPRVDPQRWWPLLL